MESVFEHFKNNGGAQTRLEKPMIHDSGLRDELNESKDVLDRGAHQIELE